MTFSLAPIYLLDILGSLAMLILSVLCMQQALKLYFRDTENPLYTYILWLISALFSFCLLRSLGHLVKHFLLFSGHAGIWARISPYGGGLITVTFIVIFAATLFFRNMLVIMTRMSNDRQKIEQTSSQLLELNRDIESVVSDRTRAEFTLQLAHEIRNPVTVIAGLLRRMSSLEKDKKQNQRYREAILDQTKKLEAIVFRFEELQTEAQEHFAVIDVNALVRDSVDIIRPEAEIKDIRLSSQLDTTGLVCQGNIHYLKVALLHILRNALEACRKGNHIQISTIRIPEGAVIRVYDDGPGIPAEVLEHIFEPFYSTKDGSTGLGLPYVRQIIREHRGDMRINSSFGHGCTVEITLPTHLSELKKDTTAA